MILPHYYLDSERQFFLENIIGSNLPAGDCYSLNASNYTVFHGKCDYNTARVNCRRHCDVLSVPEILWRTVYLLTGIYIYYVNRIV